MNFLHKHKSTFKKYVFVLLIAIECLMSFTFLGYIHIPPISITFAYIPILLAACLLDVPCATAIGLLFGLSSMFKASSYYVQPFDKLFSPFLSGFPVQSFLLSVGTRTLFGFLTGVFFKCAKKVKHSHLISGILALLAPKFHSFLVYAAMGLFFPEMGYDYTRTFTLNISDVLLSLLCLVVLELFQFLAKNERIHNFQLFIDQSGANRSQTDKSMSIAFGVLLATSLCAAVASAFYFVHRNTYMLSAYGIDLSYDIRHDLYHLQIQFLIATFSLSVILLTAMILMYKYFSYCEYLGGFDSLTKVMGRRMFLHHCNDVQRKHASHAGEDGWFIFTDIDYFKTINDTFGHPIGDAVLKQFARLLEQTFSDCGKVGRMGGDEFAVMIEDGMELSLLKEKLDAFLEGLSAIRTTSDSISCSMGVCHFHYPENMQTLYTETDQILYSAKKKGRACYVIGNYQDGTMQIQE